MIGTAAAAVLAATSLLLFVFGLNLLYLTLRALRLPAPMVAGAKRKWELWPEICVQIPVYDERYVAERVLDAVCAIDWPHDRLEVQVLDDSDDDTTAIVARRAAHWRSAGVKVVHLRRGTRAGFKAGALAYGLQRTTAPFIAIFDADFVPPPDFLRRTIGAFDDPKVAFAQARWGHLDEGYSLFTRLQAMAIDFHFLVEQAVRHDRGFFTNFTGTAGVWRRDAIEDSGGWSARTLTEDLDLSYRAQLRGWKAAFIEDLVVPEELPVSIDAYRRQQSRWATGSFQSAFRLLIPVLRMRARAAVKFQAAMHLLAYGVGPVMLVQLACYPIVLVAFGRAGLLLPSFLVSSSALVVLVTIAPWIGFIAAQTRRGRGWWSGLPALICQVVGAGMSINTFIALVHATRPGGVFVRTPKHHIVTKGQEWRDQAYVRVGDPRALVEAAAGLATLTIVPLALVHHQVLAAVYSGVFALGFFTVAGLSLAELLQVWTLRRLGREALARMRAATPLALLFGLVAVLLLLAAQMAEPFEDGYGHWLIAATLASTGHLSDPLFGMQDTWLPGYQVLAAAVLHVFGLWRLDVLKVMSAVLGLTIAACVYALAPNPRQARIAVALLVLNPVFLFTSGSAVVEPLLTAMLMSAALAASRGRMRLAALLAALACLTSTKAWIWIGAAAAFTLVEMLPSRAPLGSRARQVAWAVPAMSVLVVLQLGFAPASHSVARGSVEVVSATARGSLPADWLARVGELATTYGLAALPLAAFGALGLVFALRGPATNLWRYVYVPSGAYLAAVFGLVAAGSYSGSHRYLYPALPAAALLAAAALDRYRVVVRLSTIAAAALLAVAFVPVFSSFAAHNAGLMAAGQAASCTTGGLLTDSPVAAYYSGKSPEQISGSESLPSGRAQAVDWLSGRGITSLVVENISYYRATSVFPDLAQGSPSAPFSALGSEAAYQVPGGKTVYAYADGGDCMTATLFRAVSADLAVAHGTGKTASLARGVTLRAGATDGTGEGMGFGVPIVQYPDGWVYAGSHRDSDLSTGTAKVWQRTYVLDQIGGDAAHRYTFDSIAPRGEVQVTYSVDAKGIAIAIRPLWLAPGYSEVGVLNEQSAAFDDLAAAGQPTRIGNAFGRWMPVEGQWARLRSGSLDVEWSAGQIPGASLYAGRELIAPDFNWAGLDYMFTGSFTGASYRINVQEAR